MWIRISRTLLILPGPSPMACGQALLYDVRAYTLIDRYDASFVGMVLPGNKSTVKMRHISMRGGNVVAKVETFNQPDEKFFERTAFRIFWNSATR